MSEEKTTYTYSARDVEEAKRIRKEFVSGEKEPIDRLREIQRKVESRARIPAISLGVIAALVFGVGLCFTLVWAETLFVPGIIIGLVGIVGIALVYPLYKSRLDKEKKLVENEVRQLSDAVIGR